ncbi:MAG: hypothetical protein WB383_07860 [Acidimicrobiales bacterium]
MKIEYSGPRGGAVQLTRHLADAGIEIVKQEKSSGGGFEKRGGVGPAPEPLVHVTYILGWMVGAGAAGEIGRQLMSAAIEGIKARVESATHGRGKITVREEEEDASE